MQEASRIARKLSTLERLGFERVDVAPVTMEAVRIDRKTCKVTSGRPAMGTLVSVAVLGASKDGAEEAIDRALEEMDRLIGIFSRFEASSALTSLNEHGRLDGAPPELAQVVAESCRLYGVSRGAFDVSVEPVVNLFRESLDGTAAREPTRAEISEALELVGSDRVTVAGRDVRFARSGMAITLDGIAKGYIVDAIAATLERHGVARYLINAGGDIRAAGSKEERQPWTVAVQDPAKSGTFPDTIHLTDAAVATSGSYEVYFDRDKQSHHIVSADSGRSPSSAASVSVIAPTAVLADALATGVFVMEPQRGIEFINALPGCECLLIDRHGRQSKSSGWRSVKPNH